MILSSPLDYPFIYNASSAPPEAVAKRRVPVELFQKREEDLRVENWVKSQVASNSIMLTAAQAYAQAQSASKSKSYSTKGHRRRRPFSSSNRRHRSQDSFYDQLRLSYNDSSYHSCSGAGAPYLSTISELEEDVESEPYIFYSTSRLASPTSPIDSHVATFVPALQLAAPTPCYPFSYSPSPPSTPSPPSSPSASANSTSTVSPRKTLKNRRGSCSSLSSLSSLESIQEEE
ncbi:hypothetical protein D9758_016781 [Tetrapyrgos nigripes]|uniref:Uncharacterized protein n=1 Tax=Tetrapyrgos nigripes TaxID=182062 RepID=A0A8H5F9B3_9AGAR|nr:hypothetical protein D9758_016781 [Tetrapyrgos nigripes]